MLCGESDRRVVYNQEDCGVSCKVYSTGDPEWVLKEYYTTAEAEDAYVNAMILYEHGLGVEVRNLRDNLFEQRRVVPLEHAGRIGLDYFKKIDTRRFVRNTFFKRFGHRYVDDHFGNMGVTDDGYLVIIDTDHLMNGALRAERRVVFKCGINVYCKELKNERKDK